MVETFKKKLVDAVISWLHAEPAIVSAVLFGSYARILGSVAAADAWSDIDLHLIVSSPKKIRTLDWRLVFPEFQFCLSVPRSATGGVDKITLLFCEGEVDLVIIPWSTMFFARLVLALGGYSKLRPLRQRLNYFSTIIQGGYKFLKGEAQWGPYYATVAKLPGFRISDIEACKLADAALCDLLWVFQKTDRGELIAAQRILHRSALETSIILLHEHRIRIGKQSFQQARRAEILLTSIELKIISVDCCLEAPALRAAAWRILSGLILLMQQIEPKWRVPERMCFLLNQYGSPSDSDLA